MSNSTFTLHPSKTAMDTRNGNFSKTAMDTRNDLEVHQTNGEEERESGTSTMSTIQIAVNDALSPSETVMDKRSDLEAHRNIGKGKQAGTSPLHNFPSTIQERSNHLSNHQWRADTNGNKDTRSHDYNSYSVGRPLMFIHHEPEEEVPEQEVQVQLPDLSTPTFPVDNNLRTQCRHVSDNDKCVVETESSKNNQCVVRSFNYGSSVKEKENHDSISTGNRQPPFPSESGWEHISESGEMESWELCGNQPAVSSSQIETRSSNQNSYDLGRGQNGETPLPKLPEVPRQLLDLLKDDRFGFHEITSEDSLNIVWHARNLEHFSRKYGITNPRPVFLDHSGFVVWMVDENGAMFEWNEMEKDILYMGPDLVTGLKNYLFYPDNILCILEDGEMISEKELDKLVKQDMERLEVLAVGKVTKKNRRSKKQNK